METHQDYIDGYMDGRNKDAPEPGQNRSKRYRHSFEVGRAELSWQCIPYQTSMKNVERIEREEANEPG